MHGKNRYLEITIYWKLSIYPKHRRVKDNQYFTLTLPFAHIDTQKISIHHDIFKISLIHVSIQIRMYRYM